MKSNIIYAYIKLIHCNIDQIGAPMLINNALSHRFQVNEDQILMSFGIDKKAYKATQILNDELQERKKTQMAYSILFYNSLFKADIIDNLYQPSAFCRFDESQWKRYINEVKKLVLSVSPLDMLCAIKISKRNKMHTGRGTETKIKYASVTKAPNDLALENGIVFELFKSMLIDRNLDETDCVVLMPSPFFIRAWEQDKFLNKIAVKFVLGSKLEKDLLEKHYKNPNYCGIVRENISFMYYDKSKIGLDHYGNDNSKWLFFINDKELELKKEIISNATMESGQVVNDAIVFSSDNSVQEMINGNVKARSILILPNGISAAADSKYKSIWMLSTNLKRNLEGRIDVCRGVKRIENGNVYIEFPQHSNVVKIMPAEFQSGKSLRAIFNSIVKPVSEREEPRKSAIKRLSLTPDIMIGYNTFNYKIDSSKANVQMFFMRCEDEMEVNTAVRNEKIIESEKFKVLPKNEITEWILQEYPFSSISRVSKHELGKSVRQIVSNYYQEQFDEQKISLRTLWYIYPDMSSVYQGEEYDELKEIVFSDVGNRMVDEFTEDYYIYLYRDYYAGKSEIEKNRKIDLLSYAISFACEHNHCNENIIDSILRSSKSEKYMYNQIRKSLVKKTFTMREFRKIYGRIVKKVNSGNTEYLGVMIKLLLGLESNCICALTLSDFVEVDGLEFYQLIIHKQVTNDGKEERPLKEKQDYRYLPCSEILAGYLLQHIEKQKQICQDNYENMPLVTDKNNRKISPEELESISRNLFAELGISDISIIVPHSSKGVKETNLGRYEGDIYRSNILYLMQYHAQMTGDEKQYLMGNVAETTFGRHYCDFSNYLVQYSMFVKLRRIDAILTNCHAGLKDRIAEVEGGYIYTAVNELPLRVNIITKIDKNDCNEIEISNKYGYSIQVDVNDERVD